MCSKVLFPGSFDPFTRGHEDIVRRALSLFDCVVVAIGVNSSKQGLFPVELRQRWIESCFPDHNRVQVVTYEGLTVDFCKKNGISCILRGVRNVADYEYECSLAEANRWIEGGIETLFLPCSGALAGISSSLVRELLRYGHPVDELLPQAMQGVLNPSQS